VAVDAITVLTSEPLKAKVYAGEEALGQTPYTVHGKKGERVSLKLVKKGFKVRNVVVDVGVEENVHVELEANRPSAPTPRANSTGRVPDESPLDRIGVPSKETDRRPSPSDDAEIPRL